jgi:Leucine-rich repeat (LRR) protein
MAASMLIVPISGFWVIIATQRLWNMGRFSQIVNIIFWVVSAFIAIGTGLKSLESVRYAMRARADNRRGKWRLGVFIHNEWILVRNSPKRVLLIPKGDVNTVTEQVSENGKSVHPMIDLGNSSLNNHPIWKSLWPRIDDDNATERMRDWFHGRSFNWLAEQGYAPPIPSPAEEDHGHKQHIVSLPPHKLDLSKSRGSSPKPSDFISLDDQTFISPSRSPNMSDSPTLVPTTGPGAPPRAVGPKRRVGRKNKAINASNPIPPTPMARTRIREILAHTVRSTKLDLSGCDLSSLPSEVLGIPHLTYLDLSNNNLERLPHFVSELSLLEVLDISCNPSLSDLPESIGRLPNLRHIQADLTGFEYFPWEISICKALSHLVLPGEPFNQRQRNEIMSLLPYLKIEFVGASNEEENSINMPFRQLIAQAEAERDATEDVSINLSRQDLSALDISSLSHSKVVTLNASHNILKTIHPDIAELKTLQVLLLDHNQLQNLPESICSLEHLEWLSITNNELSTLPENIGQLKSMSQLILYGNQFTPDEQERIKETFPDLEIIF